MSEIKLPVRIVEFTDGEICILDDDGFMVVPYAKAHTNRAAYEQIEKALNEHGDLQKEVAELEAENAELIRQRIEAQKLRKP